MIQRRSIGPSLDSMAQSRPRRAATKRTADSIRKCSAGCFTFIRGIRIPNWSGRSRRRTEQEHRSSPALSPVTVVHRALRKSIGS